MRERRTLLGRPLGSVRHTDRADLPGVVMPISERAKTIARILRRINRKDPRRDLIHLQEKSDIDGRMQWLSFYRVDIETLSRDQDLQAFVQGKLIDNRIIQPPTKE